MNDTTAELMREALKLTQAGRLDEATAAIQRALHGAAPATAPVTSPADPSRADGAVVESTAHLAPVLPAGDVQSQTRPTRPIHAERDVPTSPASDAGVDAPRAPWRPGLAESAANGAADARDGAGGFTGGKYTHELQTRAYKLFTPPGAAGRALPLVVMLHGCTQDPDDFAAGTGMNEHAAEQGFFVLYPAQSRRANSSLCWNWFMHEHQQRGSGEPALLAGMTRAVIEQHGIDVRRVYIAGLSAGGAMAAIVAAAYPEMFAAVGVHSGLPRGAAIDMAGAFGVMKNGVAGPGPHARARRVGMVLPEAQAAGMPVPTIVFHGDADRTVHPRNGEQVIAAVLGGATGAGGAMADTVEQGVSAQGRRYTRSSHSSDAGDALAEHWLVHGAGHAWSGGHASGTYTDASGPDATREMLRFFFAQTLAGR